MLGENNMGSEVEVTSCSKDKGRKIFQMERFNERYKSQMAFMRLNFEADNPRMKDELRVMIAEL